jgi:hypothetical protein
MTIPSRSGRAVALWFHYKISSHPENAAPIQNGAGAHAGWELFTILHLVIKMSHYVIVGHSF